MSKLKTLQPRLRSLKDRVSGGGGYAQRDKLLPWRAWYKTARWQRLRWSVLVRDLFTCAMCRRVEADTSKLVADHREQHHGDPDLFWDEKNLQCLCDTCHGTTKQRQERLGLR